MQKAHTKDHQLIAEAISEDWLARERLLVHLARDHGMTVDDVGNDGLAALIVMHDGGHGGVRCFEEAEVSHPPRRA